MESTARKVDLRKQLKHRHSLSASEVKEVDVPKMNFIMANGKGDPSFTESLRHLMGNKRC